MVGDLVPKRLEKIGNGPLDEVDASVDASKCLGQLVGVLVGLWRAEIGSAETRQQQGQEEVEDLMTWVMSNETIVPTLSLTLTNDFFFFL